MVEHLQVQGLYILGYEESYLVVKIVENHYMCTRKHVEE